MFEGPPNRGAILRLFEVMQRLHGDHRGAIRGHVDTIEGGKVPLGDLDPFAVRRKALLRHAKHGCRRVEAKDPRVGRLLEHHLGDEAGSTPEIEDPATLDLLQDGEQERQVFGSGRIAR